MSKQWENDMAKEIHRATDDSVRTVRAGYSGSNAMPQPDILVTTPMENYGMELKGPIASERVYVEADDLEQLVEFSNGYTIAVLVVKFQNREPLVVRHFDEVAGLDGWKDMSVAEQFEKLIPSAFETNVTDSGTLSIKKPTTDDWPSARAGSSDVDAIISGVGITTEKSTHMKTRNADSS